MTVVRLSAMRHSAPLRGAAFLLLLWVGMDLGAHGLFESDFRPFSPAGLSVNGGTAGDAGDSRDADHCFCHSYSLGAVAVPVASQPERTEILVSVVSCDAPPSAGSPLYHPPQSPA
jgi:hypothetical protein